MADGLLTQGLNYIDQQKQALAARLGLLVNNPQEFAAQLGSEARQRAGVGLLGEPRTAKDMASGAWINSPYGQQAMQAGSGFVGSIKPISSKNITYDANKILVDIPVNQIMHGESIMPGGKLTFTGAKELIKEYANKKTDFPPIEIVSSDGSIPWMVADGSHRLEAAKLRGDKTIKAYISPFDKEGLELIKKK
jgi:uncharacterized ParB-like nuclease family protein